MRDIIELWKKDYDKHRRGTAHDKKSPSVDELICQFGAET